MRIIVWLAALRGQLEPFAQDVLKAIVGWFILGRDCRRCQHSNYAFLCSRYTCRADDPMRTECKDSLTYKHFKRRNY